MGLIRFGYEVLGGKRGIRNIFEIFEVESYGKGSDVVWDNNGNYYYINDLLCVGYYCECFVWNILFYICYNFMRLGLLFYFINEENEI